MSDDIKFIEPQKGFQMDFLSSPADIVIGGGAAGVGKTFSLLIDPLRYVTVKGFGGVIFRRTTPMIRNEGGLWDASVELYGKIHGARQRESSLEWMFPSGVKIKFAHIEYEKNIYDWQGSEIPFIGFDELTHFTKKMFFYLLSRNRSTSGVEPYLRATTNPDPESWVREFIDWWIGDDGYPIPERNGVLRYFMRNNDKYIWGATKAEVIEKGWHVLNDMVKKSNIPAERFVKSLTFISGSIYDNKELLKTNPEYLANLNAQDEKEKARLLYGNWNVKISGNDIFNYFKFQDIFSNHWLADTYKYASRWITSDIAMKGSDRLVIYVWQGKMMIDFLVIEKSKGNQVIDAINLLAIRHHVPNSNIIFDNDGVGQFIDGFIEGAKEFNNGARAVNGENYQNLKSQCYFKAGDSVERGEYYIPPQVADREFADGVTLKEQMMKERKAIKRAKPDYDGKLAVIPKQEMKVMLDGKSPDALDAFMMREFADLLPEEPDIYYS